MEKFIESFKDMDEEAFTGFFIVAPLVICFILGVVGSIEFFATDRIHLWSGATFTTIFYYLIGGASALSIWFVAESAKTKNLFCRNVGFFYAIAGFLLTVTTVFITLWQIHWILGGVITLVGLILITGLIVAASVNKEDDND